MADILIFGVGEAARLATRFFEEESVHRIVAYAADLDYVSDQRFQGREVVPFDQVRVGYPPDQVKFFVALGFQQMNGLRADRFNAVKQLGYSCVSYVAPSNSFPTETVIGENCFILQNQSVDRDVTIGDNVTMWSACHIGDRSRISGHVWLSSHVCLNGDVIVEERCFLGSNCTLGPDVRIGSRTLVGANSLITHDTEPGAVYTVPPTESRPIDSERFMLMLRMS